MADWCDSGSFGKFCEVLPPIEIQPPLRSRPVPHHGGRDLGFELGLLLAALREALWLRQLGLDDALTQKNSRTVRAWPKLEAGLEAVWGEKVVLA